MELLVSDIDIEEQSLGMTKTGTLLWLEVLDPGNVCTWVGEGVSRLSLHPATRLKLSFSKGRMQTVFVVCPKNVSGC